MSSIKKCVKETLKKIQLYDFVRLVYVKLGLLSFLIKKNSQIRKYQYENKVRKLHIGCDNHLINGWLNTDIRPQCKSVVYVDATTRFPFKDNSYDYVYSEHVIEHITYRDGKNFLRECYRILRNGGVLRLVTPDLKFLFDLYDNGESQFIDSYLRWSIGQFIDEASILSSVFVINNFMTDWGHKFIYDKHLLMHELKEAGFIRAVEGKVGKSSDKELINLENTDRMPEGFLELESMVFEAIK